jgi:hypothetical protein
MAELSRVYGLSVASELPLHVDRPWVPDSVEPDVVVRLGSSVPASSDRPAGDVLAEWTTAGNLSAVFVRQPAGDVLLRFESTCDVVVDASASEVTVHMVDGVPADAGAVLVSGTVLSFVLLLRGQGVIHASAVELDGGVIGFVGRSGMGKTTLATQMCRHGGRLVTDDVLRVSASEAGYRCSLGTTELRLRPASSALADGLPTAARARTTADHRTAVRVPISTTEGAPLRALLVPRLRRDREDVEVTRLERRAAALTLLSFPRILGVVDPALQVEHFDQMTRLAAEVPVLVADVPWRSPVSESIAEALSARIQDHFPDLRGGRARPHGGGGAPHVRPRGW